MSGGRRLHWAAGSLADGDREVELASAGAGLAHCGLTVVEIAAGGSRTWPAGPQERIVLPLRGSCVVEADGEKAELVGRSGVFGAVTDFAYVPQGVGLTVTSRDGGRFAVPAARATRRLPFRYVPSWDVAVELRGAGACSRQVNNFATPEALEADRIIACEVLTPAGNWSSYPPHKHDETRAGPQPESELEEIYYFEVADGPKGPGLGYQRVYGTVDRPIDVLAEVRSGDVVLVPHGWHGPSMAAPGYDLYYLNVMAGPGEERAWRICDDPAHAWVRGTWDAARVDPRLPFYAGTGGQR
ncbi:MAG: 5-deoxy-glucuronate isomerase [Actinomycetota bacterium]|nr:5-deoxy-glucuronate isomerase [Actinomycetota bacterium]